jgi:hypothetical protein
VTPVTDAELLRLARKAWPDRGVTVERYNWGCLAEDSDGLLLYHDDDSRFHAALLVLAGEVDLQALLDARAAPAEGASR